MFNTGSNTVFVTGATGFVGQNLVRELVRHGKHVRCLVRKNSSRNALEIPGVAFIEGSITDRAALTTGMSGASVVFHVAGKIRSSSLAGFRQVNQLGCRHVAEAALETADRTGSAPKIVHVSSLAAAGPAPRADRDERNVHTKTYTYRPKREDDLPNPYSAYGISKLEGEKEFIQCADRIPVTIVRPAIVFGPGDLYGLALFKMAFQRVFLVPGWFDQEFSFICVNDLVQLLIAAAQHGKALTSESLEPIKEPSGSKNGSGTCTGQGIYFAAHPDRLRFSVFGKKLAQALGRGPIWTPKCPPAAVLSVGFLFQCFQRITRYNLNFDWNKAKESLWGPWICEVTKSENDLNYSFQTSLDDQFKETADWYYEKGLLPRKTK